MKTATFKIESVAEGLAAFRDTFEAVQAGRDVNPQKILGFTSLEAARNLLTRERLALLRAIATSKPTSIYELAKITGRDLKNVQDDVRILERHGLVRVRERSRGKRAVKVLEVPFEEIELKIGIRSSRTDSSTNDTEFATTSDNEEKVGKAQVDRWLDPRQQEIYEGLLMVGAGPAAFYRDACLIMDEPGTLDSATHVVGHLIREIESALRDSLETFAERRNDAGLSRNSDRHAADIRRIAIGLGMKEEDPALVAWLRLADKSYQFAPHAVAHRDALSKPRPMTKEFGEWWNQIQSILLAVLNGLKQRFLEPLREIDHLINTPHPSAENARFLRNRIPNNTVFLGHFFDRCQNPEWLRHLERAGFFRAPPEDMRWPEAGYLARMARDESMAESICDIIAKMPETQNRIVHAELLEGIVALPAKDIASLMQKIEAWITSETNGFLLPDFGKLIRKLALGNQKSAAIRLTKILLAVMPAAKQNSTGLADDNVLFGHNPRIRTDLWNYEQVLNKDVSELVKVTGLEGLLLLCDLLSTAIQLTLRNPEESAPSDVSHVWRPAIEEHEQNRVPELKSLLARTIRDAALNIVRSEQATLSETVRALEQFDPPWRIFQRIAMYLLVELGSPDSALVTRYLLNRELFEDSDCRHEYALLLSSHAADLDRDSLNAILSWIEDAPQSETFKKNALLWGKQLSDEDVERARGAWQRDRLAWFGRALPDNWKQRYEKLVKELHEPEHPDFSSYMTSFVGPTSPKSSEDLRGLEVDSLVGYLREWQPERHFMGASREGVARELSSTIANEPQRFVAEADKFRGLHPTYVRCVINGLSAALGKKIKFDWAPVLSLCKWVLQQDDKAISKDVPYWAEEDKDWSWTRTAIAHLLESALSRNVDDLPLTLRSDLWEVLLTLSHDQEPTPEREAPKKGYDRDPVHIAINATRGVAMLAVTYYAAWLRRHFERLDDGAARVARGFDEMPEVREVLDSHLNVKTDPSLAIRSVYGMRFPWIRLLDPRWAEFNLDRIFPERDSERSLWEAAWSAYISHCNAYDDVLETLQPKYQLAIDRLGEPSALGKKPEDLENQLAAHVMSFYLRGKVDMSPAGGILVRFFANASDSGRAHALETVGRWLWQLKESKQPISPEVLNRLKKLWEWRYAEFQQSHGPARYAAEAASFVWWFRSEAFEDAWTIMKLNEALGLAIRGETNVLRDAPYATLERLSIVCAAHQLDAVQCLQKLLTKADYWHVSAFEKDIRSVLSEALRSEGDAQAVAREIIVALGRRGLLQFRSLLDPRL